MIVTRRMCKEGKENQFLEKEKGKQWSKARDIQHNFSVMTQTKEGEIYQCSHILKANRIAYFLPQFRIHFLCHSSCNRLDYISNNSPHNQTKETTNQTTLEFKNTWTAIRLGWVQAINLPPSAHPASTKYCPYNRQKRELVSHYLWTSISNYLKSIQYRYQAH